MKNEFSQWLAERVGTVAGMERRAVELLADGGMDEYGALMRKKARLLADLPADGKPLLDTLPPALRVQAEKKLRRFSESAQTALSLDSVFFMSALLYPDDHQPGQPNNLEIFLAELCDGTDD
jgi:hypothetical protein